MGAIIRAPRIRILGASAVAVSGPADTNENILATITVPAGAMGLNGILRVTTLWTVTNSGNLKTLRARLGGIGGTDYMTIGLTAALSHHHVVMIRNRGAANSQIGFTPSSIPFNTSTGANITSAIDTSAAQTFVITGQKASAGETITLESYLVELILP